MSGFSGKRLMNGSLSAMSTTLATSNAMTVAAATEVSRSPYSRSISALSSRTMLNVMMKKIVGGRTSKNSCLSVCQTLVMRSSVKSPAGFERAAPLLRHLHLEFLYLSRAQHGEADFLSGRGLVQELAKPGDVVDRGHLHPLRFQHHVAADCHVLAAHPLGPRPALEAQPFRVGARRHPRDEIASRLRQL